MFDRYSDNASTKDITHLCCSKGKFGRPVLFIENIVLRAIFCKNQAVWNIYFFKNHSFLHILFLLWSMVNKTSPIFFQILMTRSQVMTKRFRVFSVEIIFGWKSNFDTNYIQKPT